MKTSIVRIGNSHGIRIPQTLLKQCHLDKTVELEVEQGQLVIRPLAKPREGWGQAFQRMAAQGDDRLLDRESEPSQWDKTEWTW